MSLITDSDEYSPSISQDGSYIDHKNFVFSTFYKVRKDSNSLLSTENHKDSAVHAAINVTQRAFYFPHKKWIESLNANRTNHFADLEKEYQLVKEQKIIIAQAILLN